MLSPFLPTLLLPLLLASPQDQENPEDPPEARTLPETIVTARKWQELADEVPVSLTSLDAAALADGGLKSVRDASLRVPNLFVTQFSSRRLSFPTIRGVGSGQGDPAVTTYIGGVPQLTTNSTNLPLVDAERVEVLRGPQSTLYGRNAMGGVIHIIPKHPSSRLEGDASATIGNYAFQEYTLTGGGPIIDEELFFRGAAQYSKRDGYTTNDYTGNDVDFKNAFYGRAGLLWAPSASSEVGFDIYGERSRDGGFVLSDLGGLRQNPYHINQDFEGRAERDILAPSVTWTQTGDSVELTTVSAFQDWSTEETSDFDFSVIDGVRRRSDDSQSYFNQEVRLASPLDLELEDEDELKWLAAVNFFVADTSRSAANEYRPGLFPPPQQGVDTQSGSFDDWGIAVFGNVTIPVTDALELGLGVRYDHEDKTARLRRTFESGGMTFVDTRTELSDSYDQFVPEVSLVQDVGESANVYARLAKGFKAGGFNLAAPADQYAFGPETSWTGEVGTKTSWLEDTLHFTAALFYIDWSDMQLSLFDATTGGYVQNVGAATSRGFEAELRAEPLSGLEAFAGFGYTKAEFDEYVDPYGQNVQGNTLPFVPETTWNLGGTYSIGPARDHRWFLHAALVGVGDYYYDPGNREKESFTLLDLRAGIERSHWRFELWARNALGEEYVQLAFQPNPADPNAFVGENGAPATFGFTLGGGF